MSNSLQPHGLQHARPSCPSPTLGVYPSSSPLSRWWHPTISSSVIPFSFLLQSFPASGSFQMSQLFTSGGQSIGVSASTSILPMNSHDWSLLGWLVGSPGSPVVRTLFLCGYLFWELRSHKLHSVAKKRERDLKYIMCLTRLWFFQWSCMDVRVGL